MSEQNQNEWQIESKFEDTPEWELRKATKSTGRGWSYLKKEVILTNLNQVDPLFTICTETLDNESGVDVPVSVIIELLKRAGYTVTRNAKSE